MITQLASPSVTWRSPSLVVQQVSPRLVPLGAQPLSSDLSNQKRWSTMVATPESLRPRRATVSSPLVQTCSSRLVQPAVSAQWVQQQAASHGATLDVQHGAVQQEDDFELPPPVVDLDDITAERRSPADEESAREKSDSEDLSELDADEHDLAEDARMVRSPCGTRWVHASKRYSLGCDYSIWFESGPNTKKRARSEKQFEEGLQCVGTFSSVQDFWRFWNAMDLQRMANHCSLSVFKHPIKPMWEDPGNKDGGRWILRSADKDKAVDFFTKLSLSLIGGYFESHECLCGVVLSTKPKFNSISLWNNKVDTSLIMAIEQELRELLGIENDESVVVEYKDHGGALQSNQVKRREATLDPDPLAESLDKEKKNEPSTVISTSTQQALAPSAGKTALAPMDPSLKATTSNHNGYNDYYAYGRYSGGYQAGNGYTYTSNANRDASEYTQGYGDGYSYYNNAGCGYTQSNYYSQHQALWT